MLSEKLNGDYFDQNGVEARGLQGIDGGISFYYRWVTYYCYCQNIIIIKFKYVSFL